MITIKKILALGSVTALGAEMLLHGYMDVMRKEDIPQGIFKIIGNKMNDKDMKAFGEYTQKSLEWVHKQNIETIDLTNDRGFNLKGYYLKSETPSKKFVVFCHGYRADHEGDPANFERFYHEQGYNFFCMDHTAAGESDGDYVGFDYHEANDTLQWIDYLVNRFGEDIKIILHGVSMGGATVCKMASRVQPQVKLIISDCAYTSAIDQFDATARGVKVPRTKELLELFNKMNLKFAKFDLAETDVRDSVKNSKVPMLFVHGDADDFVPTRMVYELHSFCENEKDLLIVNGAKHAQSIMTDKEGYENKIIEFTNKYL